MAGYMIAARFGNASAERTAGSEPQRAHKISIATRLSLGCRSSRSVPSHAIAAAIQKAGKADPEAIRAALWELDINGLNGKIKFTKAGPDGKESGQSIPTVYLIKIENGKVVVPQG